MIGSYLAYTGLFVCSKLVNPRFFGNAKSHPGHRVEISVPNRQPDSERTAEEALSLETSKEPSKGEPDAPMTVESDALDLVEGAHSSLKDALDQILFGKRVVWKRENMFTFTTIVSKDIVATAYFGGTENNTTIEITDGKTVLDQEVFYWLDNWFVEDCVPTSVVNKFD